MTDWDESGEALRKVVAAGDLDREDAIRNILQAWAERRFHSEGSITKWVDGELRSGPATTSLNGIREEIGQLYGLDLAPLATLYGIHEVRGLADWMRGEIEIIVINKRGEPDRFWSQLRYAVTGWRFERNGINALASRVAAGEAAWTATWDLEQALKAASAPASASAPSRNTSAGRRKAERWLRAQLSAIAHLGPREGPPRGHFEAEMQKHFAISGRGAEAVWRDVAPEFGRNVPGRKTNRRTN